MAEVSTDEPAIKRLNALRHWVAQHQMATVVAGWCVFFAVLVVPRLLRLLPHLVPQRADVKFGFTDLQPLFGVTATGATTLLSVTIAVVVVGGRSGIDADNLGARMLALVRGYFLTSQAMAVFGFLLTSISISLIALIPNLTRDIAATLAGAVLILQLALLAAFGWWSADLDHAKKDVEAGGLERELKKLRENRQDLADRLLSLAAAVGGEDFDRSATSQAYLDLTKALPENIGTQEVIDEVRTHNRLRMRLLEEAIVADREFLEIREANKTTPVGPLGIIAFFGFIAPLSMFAFPSRVGFELVACGSFLFAIMLTLLIYLGAIRASTVRVLKATAHKNERA
jgi:hypothetical protein